MSFVITGASGNLGRRTAEILLDQVDPTQVAARHANPGRPERPRGPRRRRAPRRLRRPRRPARRLRRRRPPRCSSAATTSASARRSTSPRSTPRRRPGVGHVAYTSIVNPVDDNPAAVVPSHKATEEALAASGLSWTFLRNGLYSEYRIDEAPMAKDNGSFHHNLGDGRTAYVSREDCAAAAAAVLRGGSEHDGQTYNITGPALLGAAELAELYGRLSAARRSRRSTCPTRG